MRLIIKVIRRIFPVAILLGIVSSPFILAPRLIKISSVACESQYGPCQDPLVSFLSGVEGKSLAEGKRMVAEILSKEILVEDFSVRFLIPPKLKVNIIEKKPVAAVAHEGLPKYALIDKNGVVLSYQEQTLVPKVLSSRFEEIGIGERVSEEERFSGRLLRRLHGLYEANLAKLSEEALEIEIEDKLVIFPTMGDEDSLVGAVGLVLSRLNSENKDSRIEGVKLIDLRFKNPVLR